MVQQQVEGDLQARFAGPIQRATWRAACAVGVDLAYGIAQYVALRTVPERFDLPVSQPMVARSLDATLAVTVIFSVIAWLSMWRRQRLLITGYIVVQAAMIMLTTRSSYLLYLFLGIRLVALTVCVNFRWHVLRAAIAKRQAHLLTSEQDQRHGHIVSGLDDVIARTAALIPLLEVQERNAAATDASPSFAPDANDRLVREQVASELSQLHRQLRLLDELATAALTSYLAAVPRPPDGAARASAGHGSRSSRGRVSPSPRRHARSTSRSRSSRRGELRRGGSSDGGERTLGVFARVGALGHGRVAVVIV